MPRSSQGHGELPWPSFFGLESLPGTRSVAVTEFARCQKPAELRPWLARNVRNLQFEFAGLFPELIHPKSHSHI